MRKQSFLKRSVLVAPRTRTLGVIVLGLVLLALALRLFVPEFFAALATPFIQAGTAMSEQIHLSFSASEGTVQLARERDRLAQENAALANENRALAAQLADYKTLLGAHTSLGRSVAASVVARPPIAPYDALLLSLSSGEVVVGAIVTAQGGIPIGTIETVSGSVARASLFSQSGKQTQAWVGALKTPLTLVGEGSGAFSATLPKDAKVQVGDTVLIAPGGIPFAHVVRVDADPSSPTISIRMQPFVTLFSLTDVLIVPQGVL